MKKLLALTVLALTLSTAPVFAEDAAPAEKPSHEQGEHRGHGGGTMFEKMDADQDGAVSKDEYNKFHEERFTKTDANSDGKITKAEIKDMKAKMKEMKEKHGELKEKVKDLKEEYGIPSKEKEAPKTEAGEKTE